MSLDTLHHGAATAPNPTPFDRAAAETGPPRRPHTESERFLTCTLAGEHYALPLTDVVEILEYRGLTAMPMVPTFIRGVLNLRGRAVPVVDLSIHFDHAATTIGRRTTVVIVDTARDDGHQHLLGVLVDTVTEVLHIPHDRIEPPPAIGTSVRSDLIGGLARHNDQFVVILKLAHLLTPEHLHALTQAPTPGLPG